MRTKTGNTKYYNKQLQSLQERAKWVNEKSKEVDVLSIKEKYNRWGKKPFLSGPSHDI